MRRCVIFCAGEFDTLVAPIEKEDILLAADGGLLHMQQLGLTPHAAIGDFDSLGFVPENAQVFPVQKDDTDAMLAVKKGLQMGCREFLLYGSIDGPRVDHTLANIQTLCYLCERGATGYLIGKHHVITAVKNTAVVFAPDAKGILSVFCMGADANEVTLENVKYPLTRGRLTAGFPLGVSNGFIGKSARVCVDDGCLILLWEKENGLAVKGDCDETAH